MPHLQGQVSQDNIPTDQDRFFDPAWPIDCLAGFDIRSPSTALAALATVNDRATG